MPKKVKDEALLRAVKESLTETARREVGEFDGLFGSLPDGVAILLRDILSVCRDCVITYSTEHRIDPHRLMQAYARKPGFRWTPAVPHDVELALGILDATKSALHLNNVLFGEAPAFKRIHDASVIGIRNSAQTRREKADQWQVPIIQKARQMLAEGTPRRGLAKRLVKFPEFSHRKVDTIRTLLSEKLKSD